jgi:hypothetical protein
MSSARFWLAASVAGLVLLSQSAIWAAVTVNFQGHLYDVNGAPVDLGFANAVTFKPGFNPSSIACTYGDAVCNVSASYYNAAIADGNIIPVGVGVFTVGNGLFSGTGTTNAAAGTKIYLVGFKGLSPDVNVLGTSNDASYLVPAGMGTVNIDAALANQFTFGNHFSDGIQVGRLPTPEPSTFVLGLMGFGYLLRQSRRNGRTSRSR